MTSIPKEIYSRYHCADMSEYESELDFYQTFLIVTDHIPNKIVEQLIEDMATATLVDFISVFINFIKNVRIEYKEVLECRKFATEIIHHEAVLDEEGNILTEAYDEEKIIPVMGMVYRDMTEEELAELPQEEPQEEPTPEALAEEAYLKAEYNSILLEMLMEV